MKESYGDLVDRLFRKVMIHMGWDHDKTALWFRTENPNNGGISPDDFIAINPSRAERWIDSLIKGEHP